MAGTPLAPPTFKRTSSEDASYSQSPERSEQGGGAGLSESVELSFAADRELVWPSGKAVGW